MMFCVYMVYKFSIAMLAFSYIFTSQLSSAYCVMHEYRNVDDELAKKCYDIGNKLRQSEDSPHLQQKSVWQNGHLT